MTSTSSHLCFRLFGKILHILESPRSCQGGGGSHSCTPPLNLPLLHLSADQTSSLQVQLVLKYYEILIYIYIYIYICTLCIVLCPFHSLRATVTIIWKRSSSQDPDGSGRSGLVPIGQKLCFALSSDSQWY